MKLITGPVSLFGKKVEIAAYEKNIPFEFEWVPFSLKNRYDQKHSEVLRINPKQQVPILIDDDLEIFDSTLILEYFEDRFPSSPLWPKDIKNRAKARLLELTADEIIFGKLIPLANQQSLLSDDEKNEIQNNTWTQYSILDKKLDGFDYFFDQFTNADIAVYCAITLGHLLNINIPKDLKNLHTWRIRMSERDSVKKAMQPMFNFITAERKV